MKCSKHPNYDGALRPRIACYPCWNYWASLNDDRLQDSDLPLIIQACALDVPGFSKHFLEGTLKREENGKDVVAMTPLVKFDLPDDSPSDELYLDPRSITGFCVVSGKMFIIHTSGELLSIASAQVNVALLVNRFSISEERFVDFARANKRLLETPAFAIATVDWANSEEIDATFRCDCNHKWTEIAFFYPNVQCPLCGKKYRVEATMALHPVTEDAKPV